MLYIIYLPGKTPEKERVLLAVYKNYTKAKKRLLKLYEESKWDTYSFTWVNVNTKRRLTQVEQELMFQMVSWVRTYGKEKPLFKILKIPEAIGEIYS